MQLDLSMHRHFLVACALKTEYAQVRKARDSKFASREVKVSLDRQLSDLEQLLGELGCSVPA